VTNVTLLSDDFGEGPEDFQHEFAQGYCSAQQSKILGVGGRRRSELQKEMQRTINNK
jgi:hypothetical protein